MRKARITAKLDHTKPLPLQYLKLNGFVIDHLPFEEELTSLELLICGEMCIDAGVRVPETRQAPHNRWSGVVNNTLTHCMIMWPNWNGIFDASGHQCDESGDVGPAGEMDSTPVAEPLSAAEIPLPETEDEGLEDDYLGTVGHMAASMEDSESDDSDDSIYYSATEVIAGE
ncbi:hypothetical protein T440DRAFT_412435 [Plenodomus tracheiphilus IPT5]|uniref:Uncharacterized protein n=1 Tax=Plenodomus tracheiphilus IPT5 TaxID=1408161 RepID=A0A6A7BP53_9PLEO|nr:hypothetical protein T440DRAFT_412435 [Plenodomus tracheiphilus IPT5]